LSALGVNLEALFDKRVRNVKRSWEPLALTEGGCLFYFFGQHVLPKFGSDALRHK